jgi:hypothetical protein
MQARGPDDRASIEPKSIEGRSGTMERGLMPTLSEPVERRLFDAFGGKTRASDGGVVAAAFNCRDCEGFHDFATREQCKRSCRLPDSGGFNNDYFGITSATVKRRR